MHSRIRSANTRRFVKFSSDSILTSQLPRYFSAHRSTAGHMTHRHGLWLLNDIARRPLYDLHMWLRRRLLEVERRVAVIADELWIATMML
jgi:hypothetical protein